MTRAELAVDTRVRAVTRAIEPPRDLLAHLGDDGFAWLSESISFVTAGTFAEVDAQDAGDVLGALPHDFDQRGGVPPCAGPVAVGALPFRGDGTLLIPERIVGVDGSGHAWCTTLGDEPVVSGAASAAGARPRPTRFDVHGTSSQREWEDAVAAALREIGSGALDKVVLAREVSVAADAPFSIHSVLAQLRASQPGCFVYADRGFVGASPELLVRRAGSDITCRPMAGTLPRGTDPEVTEARLAASHKDGHEHAVVVHAVQDELERWCDGVAVTGPEPVTFTDLTHLVTNLAGRVRDDSTTALTLALALHPTPAVAGTPRDHAVELIDRLEATPRGRYAGPVGWVGASGDGEFAVALRCAAIDGSVARLHAGAGIVAGSDPRAEWDETGVKLEPMLRALVRP